MYRSHFAITNDHWNFSHFDACKTMCMYIDISNCSIYPISPFYFDLIFERNTPTAVTTPMSYETDTCKFLHFAFYNELAETKYISFRIQRNFTVIHREWFRRRWRLLKNWMRIGNFLRPKIKFCFHVSRVSFMFRIHQRFSGRASRLA